MRQIWKISTEIHKEIGFEILEKLPTGLKKINVGGGEPGLRKDLLDIISILHKKAKKIDISTNRYFTQRLVEVGKHFHNVAFKISVEELPKINESSY